MSVQALSRLLEAVAKSIKHATAMSMILTKRYFKLDVMQLWTCLNSYWRIPAMSCAMLNKFKDFIWEQIKEVAKGNFEAQQQKFLASSSTATNIQKMSYSAPPVFGL